MNRKNNNLLAIYRSTIRQTPSLELLPLLTGALRRIRACASRDIGCDKSWLITFSIYRPAYTANVLHIDVACGWLLRHRILPPRIWSDPGSLDGYAFQRQAEKMKAITGLCPSAPK